MKFLIFILTFFSYILCYAQQSVNSSGGNGTGSGGSFSLSIGQVDYVSVIGVNGLFLQGVQQPFEFSFLGTDEILEKALKLSIYPNPTTDVLFIKNENANLVFSYQLFDVTGKRIATSSKMVQVNQIDMTSFRTGTYILLIHTNSNLTKSFKIIKK